jgi:uncharacterized protein (TIGR03437 family)
VVVTGTATSPNFPGVNAPPPPGQGDGFVTSVFPALTVQNAADFTSSAVAPGEIVAIRGYGIGPVTGQVAQPTADGGPPTSLAGVSVSFGGIAAPLFYAQNQQINAQVPWEIAGQVSTPVEIEYQTGANALTIGPVPTAVTPAAPGIYYVNNSNGSQNSSANPANPGDFITLYGTGGGVTNPAGVTGATWPESNSYPLLALQPTVTIGGENATVLYAGASPLSSTGVFQINVLVPANLAASPAAVLVINIGETASGPIPVAIQ